MGSVNLKKNILMSGSFRIIIMAISFVTSVISTRYLGVELKGKYSYLFTMSGFIWMVLDFGIYRSFPYLIRKNPEKTTHLFQWSFILFFANLFLLSCIGFGFTHLVSDLIGYQFNTLYLVLFILLITLSQLGMQLQSIFLGLNKVLHHSLAQIINSINMLLLIAIGFVFFTTTDRLAYVFVATVFSSTCVVLYYIANHDWQNVFSKIDFTFIKKTYGSGIRVFLSTIFITLLIRFDIILIKRYLGFTDVGIYSIAAHIIDLLQIGSNVVGGLLLVKLSDNSDNIVKWQIMKKLLMVFFVLLFSANLGFAILGKFLIASLYGKDFIPVYNVYLWLIPASFGLSFGSLFNMYLNSKGFPLISVILPAISLLINILFNLLLIPLYGTTGAAIATSFAYLLWFVMIILYEQIDSRNLMFKYLIPNMNDWRRLTMESYELISNGWNKLIRNRKFKQ